jgi:carboxylesterase type B
MKKPTNLIMGLNQDEGNFWNIYYIHEMYSSWNSLQPPALNESVFESTMSKAFAHQPEAVRRAIRAAYIKPWNNYDPNYYVESLNQLVGDYYFTCDALNVAERVTQMGIGQVYVYLFAQVRACAVAPVMVQHSSTCAWPAWTGVMHGYEIEFVFGVPLSPMNNSQYVLAERRLSEVIVGAWSSFAGSG